MLDVGAISAAISAAGISQQELADRTGLSQPGISMLLAGKYQPRRRTVRLIADAIGVPVETIWPDAVSPLSDETEFIRPAVVWHPETECLYVENVLRGWTYHFSIGARGNWTFERCLRSDGSEVRFDGELPTLPDVLSE